MHYLRPAAERGQASFGWLDSRHSFSFGNYFDPRHLGFAPLRVINEDRVAPGRGFDTHGHRDMEILTVVLDGALAHRDSLGNGSLITPGEVQRMTAGSGIRHSEFNASEKAPVHFLQIWIEPEATGLAPGYAQQRFDPAGRHNRLQLWASRSGRDGSLELHQDADLFGGRLDAGHALLHPVAPTRRLWLQVVAGRLAANGIALTTGDGLGLSDVDRLDLQALADSEVLLFDMADPVGAQ